MWIFVHGVGIYLGLTTSGGISVLKVKHILNVGRPAKWSSKEVAPTCHPSPLTASPALGIDLVIFASLKGRKISHCSNFYFLHDNHVTHVGFFSHQKAPTHALGPFSSWGGLFLFY